MLCIWLKDGADVIDLGPLPVILIQLKLEALWKKIKRLKPVIKAFTKKKKGISISVDTF